MNSAIRNPQSEIGLCPEDRLLLLLCRGRVSADQEAEARQLLLQPAASVRNPQSAIRDLSRRSRDPQLGSLQPTAYSRQPPVASRQHVLEIRNPKSAASNPKLRQHLVLSI